MTRESRDGTSGSPAGVEQSGDASLDAVAAAVGEGVFRLDAEGRFEAANDVLCDLAGYDRSDLLGEGLSLLFSGADAEAVEAAIRESAEGDGRVGDVQATLLTADDGRVPCELRLAPLGPPGDGGGTAGVLRDVTEEKRRESILEQYETVVEAVDDGLYAVDEDYRFTLVNDAYCELTGYDRGELLGEHISVVVDEETVEQGEALRERLFAGDGESGPVEVEIERADGERVAVESRYAPMPGDTGGTVGVVRDVSERRAFEETLTALHEASRDLYAAESEDDVARVVLRTLTDVLGLDAATLFRLDDEAGVLRPVHQTGAAIDSGLEIPPLPAGEESLAGHVLQTGEFRAFDDIRETDYLADPKTETRAGLIAPIDDERVLVVSSPAVGAFDERDERLVELLAGNAAAALERLERERELRESERRYRMLVDNFPNGAVALYDEACQYVAVGGQMYDRIDLSPEDAVGMTVGERLSGEIAETLKSMVQRAFEGSAEEAEAPYDGRDFRLQSLPIRDDDGEVILAMVVTRDVTERKRAEEALAESERRFRTMMEQSPLSTQIFDPEGNALMVNPAWEELWDASSEGVSDYNVLEDEQLAEKGILSDLERVFEGEAVQLSTVRYDPAEIGKEGRPRWVEAFAYPVVDDAGEIREVVLVHNDVTEHKEYERELEQYERIVETVDDGVYVVDAENRLVLVNDAYCEIVGREREELLGSTSATVVGEETVAELEEMAEAVVDGETEDAVLEIAVERPDGETVTIEAHFAPFPTEDGIGRMGVIRDVTERKERERELAEQQERYRGLVESAPVPIATYDAEGRLTYVNDAAVELIGADDHDDLVGVSAVEFIHPDDRAETGERMRRVIEERESAPPRETALVGLDGETRHAIIASAPISQDGEPGGQVVLSDVTDRKAYERALAESEQRYRTLIENFPNGAVALVDQSLRYRTVGGRPLEIAGATGEELEGEPLDETLPSELADELVPRYEAALDGDPSEFEGEFDGRIYQFHFVPVRNDDGEVFAALGMSQDVTERKEYERQLEESEQRYRTLAEHFPHGAVGLFDHELRYTLVEGQAWDDMEGVGPEDLEGEIASEALPPETAADVVPIFEAALRGETESVESTLGGRTFEVWATPVRDDEGEIFAGLSVAMDVTEQREHERELEQYEAIVEAVDDGVYVLDDEFRFVDVNDAYCEMTGYDREELLGEHCSLVVGQDVTDESAEQLEDIIAGEVAGSVIEADIHRADGTRLRAESRFTAINVDGDGEPLKVGVVRDVSDRVERERALEESEQRYRTLVESYPDGAVAMFDEDLRYTVAGGQLFEAEGVDPEERIGSSIFDLYPEELIEEVEPHFRAALDGEVNSFEVHYRGLDLFNYTLPVRDADGEVLGGMLVVNDVTEQREYERQLERFQTIIETVEDGVYTIDGDGYITMVNSAYAEMVGRHREELIGMHATKLVDEDVADRAREIEEQLAEDQSGTARLTAELKTADDRTVIAEATFALLPGEDEKYERVAVVRDVTERNEREAELERALDLLDKAEDIAEVGGWEIDAETMEPYWSDQVFDLLGIPPGEEPPLDEALDIYDPEYRQIVEDAIESAFETGEPFDIEVQFYRQDDDEAHWARVWGVPELEDGEIVRLRGAFQDVTERVEREAELERALDLLHHTEDLADVGGWELDPETVEVYWTDQFFDILGMPRGEVPPLEEALDAVYHPADQPVVEEAIEAALEDGEPFDVEVRFVSRDGDRPRWARVQGIPVVEDGEVVTLRGAFQDVTGRVERERELRERIEQEDVVTELGTLALEEPDLDRLFDRATDAVAETLDNDLCKLLELQPDEESLLLRAGVGWDDGLVGETTLGTEDDSIAGRTLETEEAIVVDDVTTEVPENRPALLTSHGGRSGVSVIVGTPRDPWGVLGTYDTDVKSFSRQDLNFVQSVANILGIAIERSEREEELHRRIEQQQVVTDLGRRALEEVDLDGLFEEAVERVAETLDNEYAKVLELQPDGESLLLRSGVGWRDGLVGEGTVGTGDDSQAGHTLRSENPIVVEDLSTEERFSGPELLTSHGVRSGISTVIGPHDDPWGVLGTHDTASREFSRQDVNFLQSVANILATAIDRRTREREIEEQRNRMAAIVRLSEIVQEVDQAVIRQSSREEIDRMVCAHLVESGEYEAAWVGDVNLASGTVTPRAVAGVDDDLVEPEAFDADEASTERSPTAVAAATGESGVARGGPDAAAFPTFAREHGYRSMAAVPLAFEDVRYGVLTLFSAREDAFVGYERTILEQLGGTVGHAINAIDRKQALVGDSFTELEIRLPDVVAALDVPSTGEGEGHSITVDGTVPSEGGRVIQYVTVTGLDPETFHQAADQLPAVEAVRRIGGGDGPTHRYEVTYADPPVTSTLASYGGRIESIGFDVPDLRITVALPPTADVRQIVEALRSEFPDVTIDAQRTVTREPTSTEEYRDDLEDALTERQRTALMTAFFAGYFEWSRESTGEEVAETLGVSPSTFHQHLRAAQRKVLARLFEDD